jgi:hypothetical protein
MKKDIIITNHVTSSAYQFRGGGVNQCFLRNNGLLSRFSLASVTSGQSRPFFNGLYTGFIGSIYKT